MLQSLLLLAASQQPQIVTFTHVAASADQVIESLAASTGTKLTTYGLVGDDILVVKVKSVPLNDLLRKFADVTGAEWFRDGEKLELKRTAEANRRQAAQEALERGTAILDKVRKLETKRVWDLNTASALIQAGQEY